MTSKVTASKQVTDNGRSMLCLTEAAKRGRKTVSNGMAAYRRGNHSQQEHKRRERI